MVSVHNHDDPGFLIWTVDLGFSIGYSIAAVSVLDEPEKAWYECRELVISC